MSSKAFTNYARVVFMATLLWSSGGQTATLSIPDFPLFLTSAGVPPNLILTLDDSGSMSRAFTPDLCGNPNDICDNPYDYRLDDRFVKSADYNPIYYNPETTYTPPVNASGTSLTTSFTDAYNNGFEPAYGKVDLSNSYQPSAGLFLNTTTDKRHEFMEHYNSDVDCRSVSGTSRCQYNSTVGTGVTTWVNMSASVGCSSPSCPRRPMRAYYYVYDGTNTGCTGADLTAKLKNNNCYDIKIVSDTSGADRDGDGAISAAEANELQNFANWYSFYRTRNLMTVSAASLAMNTLSDKVRVAWQALNSCRGSSSNLVTSDCEGWQTTSPNFSNAIKPFSGTHKTNFYTWLLRLKTNTSTPLPPAMERVGNYCKKTGADSPYDDEIGGSDDDQSPCRKNYHLMMTDGIWNVAPAANYHNFDSTDQALPDGETYSSQTPYKDGNSNSLADVAFSYWAQDLVDLSEETETNQPAPSFVDLSGTELQRYFNAKNNPATWQHLVNYTVGLGLTPFLTSTAGGKLTWGTNTYDGSYPEILAGTKNWPDTNSSGVDGNAADLWHAAINSRGRFYNVEGPKQLSAAFQDIINTISSAAAEGGGSRISTNVANTGDPDATAFVAGFNADWSGKLEARSFNLDGTFSDPPKWEAGSLIPPGNLPQGAPPFQRKIFTRNSGAAQEFASCTGDLLTALNKITKKDPATGNDVTTTDNLCPQRLTWLRGYIAITNISSTFNGTTGRWQATYTAPNHGLSAGNTVDVTGVTPTAYQGKELRILETPAPTKHTFTIALTVNTDPGAYVPDDNNDDRVRYAAFRDRSSVLGDIVSSGTVYFPQNNPINYGGDLIAVEGGGSTYKAYVEGKASKPPVIYVGANDGMLHAFNAKTDVAEGGGQEWFAYVPAGVYGNLSALTDPAYGKSHKFFVDGTPTVGDAYIGGGWKTYLVGGLRKGGKSIYALDITDPVNFSATNVKWEFKDDNDLGFTFSEPQIAAVSANQWAAIFGNGYNSTNGNAVLYIVDLANGSLIDPPIEVSAPSCSNALSPNGLSTPYPFDSTGDGIVDVIYAGDLQGHLWRFDKSSGSWKVGNGNQPLFTACNASNQAQSITAQPKAALIESKTIVYFGTGRYLIADPNDPTNKTRNDLLNSDVQSFYSIVDESDSVDEDGDFTKQGTVPRDKLLPQTIEDTVTVGSYTGRIVSNHKVTDTDYIGRDRGCYLDFTTTPAGEPSERITSGALIRTFKSADLPTRFIFVTSVPTSDPCAKSGISWLMELGTNCGRLEGASPFDLNGDDKFDKNDLVPIGGEDATVSGLQLNVQTGLVNEIATIGGSSSDPDHGIFYKLLPGTSGKVEKVTNSDDKPPSGGGLTPKRIYWEQIQ